jgi:hypothetical protein
MGWGVKKVSGRSAVREMNVASIQLPRPEGTRGLDLGIKGRGGVGANAGAKRAMGTHEVDADGGDVALGVGIVGETEEKARFADAGVTDQLRRRGVEGGNFGETLSFDEGRISAQIWAERGARSGIPWGRIDVVSSFHDGSDSGAHQELEEVVTAVHAGKGGERGTSASRNLPGGRDVGGTEEERVDGEPRARRTVVATRPGGGRGHEGDVALTTRGSSCLNAACAQPRMAVGCPNGLSIGAAKRTKCNRPKKEFFSQRAKRRAIVIPHTELTRRPPTRSPRRSG